MKITQNLVATPSLHCTQWLVETYTSRIGANEWLLRESNYTERHCLIVGTLVNLKDVYFGIMKWFLECKRYLLICLHLFWDARFQIIQGDLMWQTTKAISHLIVCVMLRGNRFIAKKFCFRNLQQVKFRCAIFKVKKKLLRPF